MNLGLTEEQRQIQNLARNFVEKKIAPRVRDYDRAGEFPEDIKKKLGELGFLGGPVPAEYNGPGMDYISYALTLEEMSRVCSVTRTII